MQTNHTDLAPLLPAAKKQIRRTLATQEPCTFEQILFEMECPGIDHLNAMPVCILALAELIQEGALALGLTASFEEDPMEYAWLLSNDALRAVEPSTNEGLWILGRA